MSEEMIDVLDERGHKTGKAVSRSEIHSKGLWHRTAQVYIINQKNEVLLQLRSQSKASHPNKWYLSAGGHVESGQTSLFAARRETLEEIGWDIPESDFMYIGTVSAIEVLNEGAYQDKEFNDVYLVHNDIELHKLKKQDSEVADLRWIPIEEFRKRLLANDSDFLQSISAEYLFIYLKENALYVSNK